MIDIDYPFGGQPSFLKRPINHAPPIHKEYRLKVMLMRLNVGKHLPASSTYGHEENMLLPVRMA